MNCPLFIDYTRECMKELDMLPVDTLGYCTTDKYSDCPFYRILNNLGSACVNIRNCPIFAHFKTRDFENFIKLTQAYCLCENYINCNRYLLKKAGEIVPIDLLPEGIEIK